MPKDFRQELEKMLARLQSGAKFSFSKYADGEWAAMLGHQLDNKEFDYKSSPEHQFARQKLIESFQYKHPDYYVGISCECCQGVNHFLMKQASGQQESQLTYANIWVNSNYEFMKNFVIPEFSNHNIHLVANRASKIENLPFKVEKFYPIDFSAYITNYGLIEEIKAANLKDKLFLFCAGPFGNLLAHQLWDHNKNNTYLDIGSTLNPWLQSEGFKRDYYIGGGYAGRTCIWR